MVQNAQDQGLVVKWDTGTVVYRSRSRFLSVKQSFGKSLFYVFVIAHGKHLQSIDLLIFFYFCCPSCCALLSNDSIETLSEILLPSLCDLPPPGSDFEVGRTRSRFCIFWRLQQPTIICNFSATAAGYYTT